MTSVLQQASEFVSRGIGVCPIPYRRKIPAQKWQIYENYMPTQNDLKAWFCSDLRNYGIVLSWQRLAVLDFDDMQAYYDWELWAIDNCRLLDMAYRVKTNRGLHVYFSLLEDCYNLKLPSLEEIRTGISKLPNGDDVPGVDFKVHGFVIGPGSTHPSGHKYAAMNNFYLPVIEKLTDVLPAEMLEMSARYDENTIVPVNPPGEAAHTLPGALSVWDEAEQGTLFDDLSPIEKIKLRWKLETFFPGEKPDHSGFLHVACPFHKDTNPSAWVDTHNQLFGCHRCNMKPMTVIGFYAALHQIEIRQAIKEMLK